MASRLAHGPREDKVVLRRSARLAALQTAKITAHAAMLHKAKPQKAGTTEATVKPKPSAKRAATSAPEALAKRRLAPKAAPELLTPRRRAVGKQSQERVASPLTPQNVAAFAAAEAAVKTAAAAIATPGGYVRKWSARGCYDQSVEPLKPMAAPAFYHVLPDHLTLWTAVEPLCRHNGRILAVLEKIEPVNCNEQTSDYLLSGPFPALRNGNLDPSCHMYTDILEQGIANSLWGRLFFTQVKESKLLRAEIFEEKTCRWQRVLWVGKGVMKTAAELGVLKEEDKLPKGRHFPIQLTSAKARSEQCTRAFTGV